jgi:hypothetical protein
MQALRMVFSYRTAHLMLQPCGATVDDNLVGAWEAEADSWDFAAEAVIGDATRAHKLPGFFFSWRVYAMGVSDHCWKQPQRGRSVLLTCVLFALLSVWW